MISVNSCHYLTEAGRLAETNSDAVEIKTFLETKNLPPETRRFLQAVVDIKGFSVRDMGLAENESYTRFVQSEGDCLVYTVSAAKKDRFEAFYWNDALTGTLPYRHFMSKEQAVREAGNIRKKDYDTYIRKLEAVSTLGTMDDPVYSYMADYTLFELARLIIHEQVHNSIYVKNQARFNENLASFLSTEGALAYIRLRYGSDSQLYQEARDVVFDELVMKEFLEGLCDELETLYGSQLNRSDILRDKARIIDIAEKRLADEYDSIFRTDRYSCVLGVSLDNAYLMTHLGYFDKWDVFNDFYHSRNRDLKKTINAMRSLVDSIGNVREDICSVVSDWAGSS